MLVLVAVEDLEVMPLMVVVLVMVMVAVAVQEYMGKVVRAPQAQRHPRVEAAEAAEGDLVAVMAENMPVEQMVEASEEAAIVMVLLVGGQ